ncbi:putative ribose/galactose/methyl galactoside import ATP-binding protein 1 [Bryobacterales bacterium F-183]|nr:putative ribose/galactose/methyl galactoside import ATP-binding protein 1 [Bryobacterales bacterium F-183]
MLLELKDIRKTFGGVTALRSGNLSVKPGEVHLLMGENGAGKSTLMKIVAGMYQPDGGEIRWNGQPVQFANPAQAASAGIAMVHQESLLFPHLTVAENIYLGRTGSGPFVSRRQMLDNARKLIEDQRFPLQADWLVSKLSPAGKQMVEICRAVSLGSSLLIFDEPTSSLSESETREVFRIVKNLRDRGMGVIYITHRLEELRTVGDHVTVLRDGATVHSSPLAELDTQGLIRHMVGREVAALYSRTPVPPGEPLLVIENLCRKPLLQNINLTVRAGEIVGMAGLVGAGRTELCRAIFGVDQRDSGSIAVCGQPVKASEPREAVQSGVALITEDRQKTGLATQLSIACNVTMANLDSISSYGTLDLKREKTMTSGYQEKLRIKMNAPTQLAGRLSGGNQQKVVISKWLATGAKVFLFDEPTRGIDVGAKVEVFQVMDELARNGAAILMVSSELPEIQQVADRIVVMRQGRISGELPGGASQEDIMRLAVFETESGRMPGEDEGTIQ